MTFKLPTTITEEELIEVLKITKKDYHKLAFALGFYCCLRVSEVVKLQPKDINKQLKLLYIKQAKGHKDRNIPIAPEVMRGLKHLPIPCGIRALQIKIKEKCKKALGKESWDKLIRLND